MPPVTDTLLGVLKVIGIPENLCINTAPELIKALPQYLAVQVPATITNVVISASQPGDDQRQSLWIRMDSVGNFVGIFVYAIGQWRSIYPVTENQFFRIYGDSTEPPEGFVLATEIAGLTTLQKQQIRTTWLSETDPVNGPFFVFDVVYRGF